MPEIDTPFENYHFRLTPLDVLKAVGGKTLELFKMHQLASHGDHFNSGASVMLDRELYDKQLELPYDRQL